MNHAGIVHPAVPALCYLLAQIRQTNIGTVTLNQFLFSVFAGASQRHPAAGGVGFNVMAVTANRFQITKVTDVSSIQLPPPAVCRRLFGRWLELFHGFRIAP